MAIAMDRDSAISNSVWGVATYGTAAPLSDKDSCYTVVHLLWKETPSQLINCRFIGTHQEIPTACNAPILSLLIGLLGK